MKDFFIFCKNCTKVYKFKPTGATLKGIEQNYTWFKSSEPNYKQSKPKKKWTKVYITLHNSTKFNQIEQSSKK